MLKTKQKQTGEKENKNLIEKMDFRECCVRSTKAVSVSVMMMIRGTNNVSGCSFKYRVSAASEKLFSDSKAFTKERVVAFFYVN